MVVKRKKGKSRRKILITGGVGFIGSHLCEQYVHNGDSVLCLDNFSNANLTNVRHLVNYRNFKLLNGDILDLNLLEKIMPDIDSVIHLAAQIHVDRSIIEPMLTYKTNVIGTFNILEMARRYDVDRLIYASSSEVYGTAQYSPMDESHPLDAPHPYGASKIAADRLCNAYNKTYGMNISIIRPFNIFGPKQKDSGYGGVISIFTKRVLNNLPPIIYGNGEQTRDYTYIKDVVRAYDLVLNYEQPLPEALNLGTGRDVKIRDLAKMIISLCEKDLDPVFVEPRPGEVQRLIANNSLSYKILGWKPHYSIEEGLKEYIDWYSHYKFEEWAKPG